MDVACNLRSGGLGVEAIVPVLLAAIRQLACSTQLSIYKFDMVAVLRRLNAFWRAEEMA